jgi:hypothetical protein
MVQWCAYQRTTRSAMHVADPRRRLAPDNSETRHKAGFEKSERTEHAVVARHATWQAVFKSGGVLREVE